MQKLLRNLKQKLGQNTFLALLVLLQTLVGFLLLFIGDTSRGDTSFEALVRWLLVIILFIESTQILSLHFTQIYKRAYAKLLIVVVAAGLALLVNFYSNFRAAEGLNFATTLIALLSVYTFPLWWLSRHLDAGKHWQYTFKFAWEMVTSYALSLLLYMGLVFALSTINFLFGDVLSYQFFQYTAVFCFIAVARWLLIARRPLVSELASEKSKNPSENYPRILEIVNKYLLIPLVALNLIILGVYFLARLFNYNERLELTLPAYVIALFTPGLIGMASQLPKLDHSRIFRTYGRVLSIALVIYLVPYFVAVLQNYLQLGFTVYLGHWLVFGLVLAIIAVTYQLKPQRFLPVALFTLAVVPFVSVFMPVLNSYSVAAGSQTAQLVEVLQAAGRLTPDGTINSEIVLDEMEYELAAAAYDQLEAVHGFSQLKDKIVIDGDLNTYGYSTYENNRINPYDSRSDIIGPYPNTYPDSDGRITFILDENKLNLNITGYTSLQGLSLYPDTKKSVILSSENEPLSVSSSGTVVSVINQTTQEVVAVFELGSLTNSEEYTYTLTLEQALLDSKLIGNKKSALLIRSVSFDSDSKSNTEPDYQIQHLEGYLLN